MRILRPAALYFAGAFATGFALGSIRVPLLVPHLGARTAELIELPILLLLLACFARCRQRRTQDLRPRQQLAVGALALLFLLLAEVALGVAMQQRAPLDVLLDRDPVSGPAYYLALLLFALLPWLWARRAARLPPTAA